MFAKASVYTIYKQVLLDLDKSDEELFDLEQNIFYPSVYIGLVGSRKNIIKPILKNILFHATNDLVSIKEFESKLLQVEFNDPVHTHLYKACGQIFLNSLDLINYSSKPKELFVDDSLTHPYLKLNQIKAIEQTISQGFKSGIHHQIMGAGKSFILLNTISVHQKLNPNPKIYLVTTDRIEIFVSLFIKNKETKFIQWEQNQIINMKNFVFIENIINKTFDPNLLIPTTKSIIWVCNNAFLKASSRYKLIPYEYLGLVLVDEAHSVSGKINYSMLSWIKSFGCEVIGFSATPLRPIRSASKQLVDIYGISNKLNIISNYNMIDALADERILPINHTLINKSSANYLDVIQKYYLDNLSLPYSKGVIWVNRISTLNEYYDQISKIVPNIFKSYSGVDLNDQISKFEDLDSNGLLLCVNRCKEGSDIKNLDCEFLLNPTKKRSIVVALQSLGRVMRHGSDNQKKCGYVYEIVDLDQSPEIFTVDRLLEYYKMIYNLAELYDQIEFADQILKLNEKVKITNGEITIQISETCEYKIDICNIVDKYQIQTIDWSQFELNVKKLCEQKIKQQIGIKDQVLDINSIYRVAINTNKLMRSNYIRTVKTSPTPTWGCKESVSTGIKPGDLVLFEIDTNVDIYRVLRVSIDPDESTKLWNDKIFSRIIKLEFIKTLQVSNYLKYINELAGYKEAFAPRTITIVKSSSKLAEWIR